MTAGFHKDVDKKYSVQKTGTSLVFRTAFFRPEKGSVLHTDIYNREFISALASSALAGGVYMVAVMQSVKTSTAFGISVVFFIAGFLLFRKFVFPGRYLQVVFDVPAGTAEIFQNTLTGGKKEVVAIRDISDVGISSRKDTIENPDGVAFVEKISHQHGMVIPGFGEETTFFMLTLVMADATERIIYADSDRQSVTDAQAELKEFLKI